MYLPLFKLVSIAAIFLTGLVGGLLSLRLSASARSERLFSLGSAFAGGVFLGAGLIHMIPDARQGFLSAFPSYAFPWVSLICACGFLLVLFIERVLFHGHDAVAESGRAELAACAAFDSLAAGTFLYIAVVDIVGGEFIRPGNRLTMFALLTFGLAFMAVLAIWA
jgi:zinc transporter ZupT